MTTELSKDVTEALAGIKGQLDSKFSEYENKMKESGSVSAELRDQVKGLSDDFAAIQKDVMSQKDAFAEMMQKGVKIEQNKQAKSMGARFIESDQFAAFKSGSSNRARVEFQANTISGESGSPLEPDNTIVPLQTMPGIIPGAFRQLRVKDLVPQGVATGNTVHYTKENVFTNAAAETSEAAQKAEATLTFTAADVPVRTIAHFLKVTKQVMDDAPALQSYIDSRLRYGVDLRIEQQIVAGNGTSPNIGGILASGNFTNTVATSGFNNLDYANQLKYAVIASDYMPDFFLVNPADWAKIERLKKGTGDASYIGQEGAISYIQNGMTPTLWGLPVVWSNSVTSGKLICASRDAMMYWNRQGTVVEIFDQNEDDVEKNLLTIRAEARGAFTVFRAAAICAGDLPD